MNISEIEKRESIVTCLEDDAAALRDADGDNEISDNMDAAAALIRELERQVKEMEADAMLYRFLRAENASVVGEWRIHQFIGIDWVYHENPDAHIYAAIAALNKEQPNEA